MSDEWHTHGGPTGRKAQPFARSSSSHTPSRAPLSTEGMSSTSSMRASDASSSRVLDRARVSMTPMRRCVTVRRRGRPAAATFVGDADASRWGRRAARAAIATTVTMRVVGGWRWRATRDRERAVVAAMRGDAEGEEEEDDGFGTYAYEDEDEDEDEDEEDEEDEEVEEDEGDVIGGGFARSMYDEDDERAGSTTRGRYYEDADDADDDDDRKRYLIDDEDDDEDDDEVDYSGNASGGSFGDIDVVAGELELEDMERDVAVEKSRHFVDENGNLQGRALYVCQLNWWLRVKNMQTYPPSKKEIYELVERTGVEYDDILAWYDERCDEFNSMSVAEQADYEAECAKKQEKLEELVAMDFADRSSTHFIEEDIFYDEAGLMHESDMDNEPLTFAMENLDEALRKDEEEDAMSKGEYPEDGEDGEGGLDASAIKRIFQDGSKEHPYLINPREAQDSGDWELISTLDIQDAGTGEDADEWLDAGGWDALPQHEITNALDGGSLSFIGVQNNEMESGERSWLRERALNTKDLEVAEPIETDCIDKDPARHFGDVSRVMHHTLEIDQVLQGVVVAMDLYHGALVDCGTEIDALIPINETDWMKLREHINIGTELEVKVTEIRSKWWRFRYPLEVLPTRQDLVHMIGRHPHPYGSPINVYAGEDWKDACRDAGRELTEEPKTADAANADRERYIEDFKKDSTLSQFVGQLSEYEKEMLAAGVDDNGTNLSYTKALEARMSGDDEFEDEEDDADSELYDDDVDSLENEDLDENDDDDDDDSGAPFDEVSSDMRGGSMKIRDKFDDDDDDDETYDDDDDDDYPGAR